VKFGNEAKIGIMVVFAILIGVVGFRVMRDVPILNNGNQLLSVFSKVDGLSVGKKIYFNGVDIGSISEIVLTENDSVLVVMNIDSAFEIPNDSRAVIQATDFLGTKAVVIQKGNSSKMAEDESYLKGVFDEGSLIELQEKGLNLSDKVTEIGQNLNNVLKSIDQTLNEEVKNDVKNSISEVEKMTSESRKLLQENRKTVANTLKSLENMASQADSITAENRPEIKKLIASFQQQLDAIDRTSQSIDSVSFQLTVFLKKINAGEGTLGKLANDSSLYTNLDSLAVGLNTLIRNIDRDPKRYFKHIGFSLF
jgi:phospholipid/cholesterol/gamma-HCH transport system substrate-binding protein